MYYQTDNMYYLSSKELPGSISQNQISDISSVSCYMIITFVVNKYVSLIFIKTL